MKKLFWGLMIILLGSACENVARFSEIIPDLGARWETATAQVTEFAATLNDERFRHQQTLRNMQLPQNAETTLGRETVGKLNELKVQYAGYQEAFNNLNSQVEAFVSRWQEESGNLLILQEGLETGKLPANAPGQIANLEELVANAAPNLADWQSKLKAATDGSATVAEEFKMILEEARAKQ